MRWIPSSEAELEQAKSEGLLAESHHCDLKRMPAKGRSANRDIAKDLASMAVDGGMLVYGVDERTGQLSPFELEGFRERVDQVARSLIDEPLHVRVADIRSAADAKKGYAVVIIPESPSAPHMVEGRYRGRGDTTNIVLSDAEVLRLHAHRQRLEQSIEDLLKKEIDRDPTPEDKRHQAHMFVVAEPVSARNEMFLEALAGEEATNWISQNLIHGQPSVRLSDEWSPDLRLVARVGREAEGWAAHSGYMAPGRTLLPEADEDDLLHIEFRENGGLRLFCGRASDSYRNAPSERVVFESLIGGLTLRIVLMAAVVGEACGHFGNWNLGLAVTNLRGAASYEVTRRYLGTSTPYSDEDYFGTTIASREEIEQDPLSVTNRLFARLNRGLNGGKVPVPRPLT